METLERFSKFYNKNRHWILGGGLLILAIGVAIAVYILLPDRLTVDEKLYLSEKYLRDDEYQMAFYEAEDILDFDPECVEAYRIMALAYEGLGNMTDAVQILREGVVKTDSMMLKKMLVEREGNFMVGEDELEDESTDGEMTSDTESTAEPTTEEPTTTKKETTTKKTTTKKPTTTKKSTTTAATTTVAPEETTTLAEETTNADDTTEGTEGESGSEEITTTPAGDDTETDESTSESSSEGDSSSDASSEAGASDSSADSETTSVEQ